MTEPAWNGADPTSAVPDAQRHAVGDARGQAAFPVALELRPDPVVAVVGPT